MQNNDIIRTLRYALSLSDPGMIEVFTRGGNKIGVTELAAFLLREDDNGYVLLGDELFESFLDGLIILKRGERETKGGEEKKYKAPVTNNMVLKKLRIALNFKEDNMIEIFKLGGIDVSKSELTALFRREGHKHYKECGDQYLRNFLAGLGIYNKNK